MKAELDTATYRLVVDPELCQGHLLCSMRAPDLFQPNDDDGHSRTIVDIVPADRLTVAREAVAGCPEQAIRLVHDA